jgi:hypothetical protein
MAADVLELESEREARELRTALRESIAAMQSGRGPEVFEAFRRHLREGKEPREAARLARIEHGKAVAKDVR